MTSDTAINFTVASEDELNQLLAGHATELGMPWPKSKSRPRLVPGSVGVIWEAGKSASKHAMPLALVIDENDQRRLYGRVSQVREEFSPISTWCHVLNPEHVQRLETMTRPADLGGLDAAWSGLAIAEASLLTGVPVTKLRTSSCFATQTFAIAKTRSLWQKETSREICEKLYQVRRLLGVDDKKLASLSKPFYPIWSVLCSVGDGGHFDSAFYPLIRAVTMLAEVRLHGNESEAAVLAQAFRDVLPESSVMEDFELLGPEARLEIYDHLIYRLRQESRENDVNGNVHRPGVVQECLAFLAGYIATVAAGGASSMALLNDTSATHPQVTGWAYAIGGVGIRTTWTSSFGGLGRHLARELKRPFRLDNPPDCDFALDEALVLVDRALSDPLVHLKVKQARTVSVSIYPGVNITVPLQEAVQSEGRTPNRDPRNQGKNTSENQASFRFSSEDILDLLADAVLERMENRLGGAYRDTGNLRSSSSVKSRRSSKTKES